MRSSHHVLGWHEFFSAQVTDDEARDLWLGRVIENQRGLCRVTAAPMVGAAARAERWATLPGRLRHQAAGEHEAVDDFPVVGDWLLLDPPLAGDDGPLRVRRRLARRSALKRARPGRETAAQVLAANVDKVLVVSSANLDLNPRRLERYVIMAWDGGAQPVIVVSKIDLPEAADWRARAAKLGPLTASVPWVGVSAATGEGLDALARIVGPGETAVLVGSSGVGKSTLTNAMLGAGRQATQGIRAGDDKGRHTTTARSLFSLPGGGFLIDTPGMRELGLWDEGEGDGMGAVFGDVEDVAATCRFGDCSHGNEPGCAVREAIAEGRLDQGRWDNWVKLKREEAYRARRQDKSAAAAERQKWKAIHKEAKRHMQIKRGGN